MPEPTILAITVNHGTSIWMELMLRSLLHHHRDRRTLQILVLDNDSPDINALDWCTRYGVEICQSSYGLTSSVVTHGEIVAAAILDHPDPDFFLLLDPDLCFLADDTISNMVHCLQANGEKTFAAQAPWLNTEDGTLVDADGAWKRRFQWRVYFKDPNDDDWPDPAEFESGYVPRPYPYCLLVRNEATFRTVVQTVGLSMAVSMSESGALWWDTFALATAVMETHGKTWTRSTIPVAHFTHASWKEPKAADVAERDLRLAHYRSVEGQGY